MASQTSARHVPVLLPQVLGGLGASDGGQFVDCTVNGGGHAAGILSQSTPTGHLLGLDVDPMHWRAVLHACVGLGNARY